MKKRTYKIAIDAVQHQLDIQLHLNNVKTETIEALNTTICNLNKEIKALKSTPDNDYFKLTAENGKLIALIKDEITKLSISQKKTAIDLLIEKLLIIKE